MKLNYWIVLLLTVFIVGCTDAENASVTDVEDPITVEAAVEEETMVETELEETSTDEAAATSEKEEATTEPVDERFAGYELI